MSDTRASELLRMYKQLEQNGEEKIAKFVERGEKSKLTIGKEEANVLRRAIVKEQEVILQRAKRIIARKLDKKLDRLMEISDQIKDVVLQHKLEKKDD